MLFLQAKTLMSFYSKQDYEYLFPYEQYYNRRKQLFFFLSFLIHSDNLKIHQAKYIYKIGDVHRVVPEGKYALIIVISPKSARNTLPSKSLCSFPCPYSTLVWFQFA